MPEVMGKLCDASPSIFVVAAVHADRLIAAVRRFHGESGHEIGAAQEAAIRALCADGSLGRAWLLTVEGQVAGYALACWRHSIDHGGRIAVLDDLWIDPDFRGRGLGRALLEAALADAAANGARAAILEADAADGRAVALYESVGFARKGTSIFMKEPALSR